MPITDIDHRARTLGRIRAGEFDDAKGHPTAGTTWRLTSPWAHLLEAAAELYGGSVTALDRADTDDRYQLTTDTSELDVVIPPQSIDDAQWYEAYTAAGLAARCDGVTVTAGTYLKEHNTDQHPPACVCNPDNRRCKPTTRLNFVLPDLPDVGVWRLTTRSIYAAAELPAQLELLFARSQYPTAVLALEARSTKSSGETHRYTVPILRIRSTLTNILAGGSPPKPPAGEIGAASTPPTVLDAAPPLQNPSDEADAAPPATNLEDEPHTPPQKELTPLERNLVDLGAFLDDHHPYNLPNAADVIRFCQTLYEVGIPLDIWDKTLDELAAARLKAFRGPTESLDVAVNTFAARAEAVDLPELRTFATRLWMEAQTFYDNHPRRP